jgi:hypothetical protein
MIQAHRWSVSVTNCLDASRRIAAGDELTSTEFSFSSTSAVATLFRFCEASLMTAPASLARLMANDSISCKLIDMVAAARPAHCWIIAFLLLYAPTSGNLQLRHRSLAALSDCARAVAELHASDAQTLCAQLYGPVSDGVSLWAANLRSPVTSRSTDRQASRLSRLLDNGALLLFGWL